MSSVIKIKERRQDFMPYNFPVEDIHLIVELPVLFNACIKLGVVIDVFLYLVPHIQRIPAEDVVGYVLVHPEGSVRDIYYQGLFLLKIDGVEHITYVRCISCSSSSGAGTNVQRPGASF
ncbi:uncharacterized protein TNCV_892671 [Trichonephila clavipes]|nr:uncharacterized protein TNCV_892671 [Trichonephila clavipes]